MRTVKIQQEVSTADTLHCTVLSFRVVWRRTDVMTGFTHDPDTADKLKTGGLSGEQCLRWMEGDGERRSRGE